MDTGELRVCAYGLLIKIKVVTGWSLPEEEFLDVLVDQFEKKLTESYRDVNVEEMEYAVRTYGTVVKDWGKLMNLSLIDDVMIPYLTKRVELSQIEESKAIPMLEQKLSDITNKDLWDQTKEMVRKRKLTVEFVPLDLYEWAIKEELINPTVQDKWRYLGMAVEYRQAVLYANVSMDSTRENNTIFSEFMRMKNAGAFEGEEKTKLVNLSKKMLLFDEYLR